MSDHMSGEVVKQIGLFVVGDVVEIDQCAHQVILEPLFGARLSVYCKCLSLRRAQALNENVTFDRLKVNSGGVEREWVKAASHFTLWHNQDSWDVYSPLNYQLGGLGDNLSYVRCFEKVGQYKLIGRQKLLDLPHNLCGNLRLQKTRGTRQMLMFLDDLVSQLRNLLLSLVGEDWRGHAWLSFGSYRNDRRRRLSYSRTRACACTRRQRLPAELIKHAGLHDHRHSLLQVFLRLQDHLLQPNGRIRAVGFVHNLLKLVVRDDVQPVNGGHAYALAVRQPQ